MTMKQIASFPSPRVKSLCGHPTQPLLLASLYTGEVQVWNTETMSLKRTVVVSKKPCRTAIFYEAMGYIIAGDDEGCITAMDMAGCVVSRFVAHDDFIRRVVVSGNFLVSCSDDCTLKSWCLQSFRLISVFDSHKHFVMDVTPELVSVSLDATVKFWTPSGRVKRTINAHKSGINCVAFITPDVFVTGSDDPSIKAWDPNPITTLTAHTKNVNRLVKLSREFASCSEDGSLNFWNFNFGLERSVHLRSRVWDVAQKSGRLFVATDEALVVLEDKKEQVLVSMGGDKVFYTQGSAFYYHRVGSGKKAVADTGAHVPGAHGPPISAAKEVCLDYFPEALSSSPSGKMISLVSDNTFTIYSVLGFRSRQSGCASEVVFVGDQEYLARGDAIYFYRKGLVLGKVACRASRLFLAGNGGCDFESIDFDILNKRLLDGLQAGDGEDIHVFSPLPMQTPVLVMAGIAAEDVSITLAMAFDGTLCFRTSLVPTFVFAVRKSVVLCTETRLVVVDEAVRFTSSLSISEAVASGDVVYIKSNGKLYYLLVPDHTAGSEKCRDPVLYPLGGLQGRLVGATVDFLFYHDGDKVHALAVDSPFVRWQLSTMDGVDAPTESTAKAVKFLQLVGEHERALALATDENLRFEILLSLGRLDEALDLANNHLKHQKLAKEFLKRRAYDKAAECFYQIGDFYNCYLVDFQQRFKIRISDSNLGFFVALGENDYKKCAEMLKPTLFYNVFVQNYIG